VFQKRRDTKTGFPRHYKTESIKKEWMKTSPMTLQYLAYSIFKVVRIKLLNVQNTRDQPIYRPTDVIGRYMTFRISADRRIWTLQW